MILIENPANFKRAIMKIKFTLLALLTFIISSCQYQIHSGTLISEEKINELQNKPITKEELEEKLGSPSIIPEYSKDTWYYVHRNMTKRAFFLPVVQGQRIVKFVFNGEILSSIEAIDNENNADIKVVEEYTRTRGTELNPMQEYVKNFGRFNKGKKKDSRR